jgi:hypothetical protein
MKSLRRIPSKLPKLLFLAALLALVPAALARNTWHVNGKHGSDNNDCKSRQHACKTIGHAISLASWGDTIMVAPATYKENPIITISLKIIGSGAKTTIVENVVKGRVFTILSTTHVRLSKLTIRNGYTYYSGGGIGNRGTLTIDNCTITRNRSAYQAGGIANWATLTINNSTISGNDVEDPGGPGGIYNGGTLTINNSTIIGNGDPDCGDGIDSNGTLTISNSTISENRASGSGGGINGNATLQNTILANNSGGNCNGTMTSEGYNLSDDGTCSFNGPGDFNNTDPKLGKLGYHGGSTQTIPLLEGSPAIDAGNPNGCTDGKGHLLKTDQRGKPRPDREDKTGCDMGAFERQSD